MRMRRSERREFQLVALGVLAVAAFLTALFGSFEHPEGHYRWLFEMLGAGSFQHEGRAIAWVFAFALSLAFILQLRKPGPPRRRRKPEPGRSSDIVRNR